MIEQSYGQAGQRCAERCTVLYEGQWELLQAKCTVLQMPMPISPATTSPGHSDMNYEVLLQGTRDEFIISYCRVIFSPIAAAVRPSRSPRDSIKDGVSALRWTGDRPPSLIRKAAPQQPRQQEAGQRNHRESFLHCTFLQNVYVVLFSHQKQDHGC